MFFEVEFPRTLSFKALGGDTFSTIVNEGFSGDEQRNRNWATTRGKWNVSLKTPQGIDPNTYIQLVQSFFLVVGGKADAFRFRDAKDYQFLNQTIGIGTGSSQILQLTKSYVIGARSYIRNIVKPITPAVTDYKGNALPQTITIYFNGTPQSPGSYTVDYTTGLVTLTAPGGNVITADGQFHYPVRFDTDEYQTQVEDSNIGHDQGIVSWNSIGLMEVRPPNY